MAGIKPRLLHLRGDTSSLPRFIKRHLDEQRRCLAQWFEVVVREGVDLDYDRLCDEVQPDVALLESGVYSTGHRIRHTDAHPEVLKLGFLHADAYCISRAVAVANFDRWGVDEAVTTSMSMSDYTPALEGRLFVWPNFVDETLYRPYFEPKTVPVLLTGSTAQHYPWRIAVARDLAARGLVVQRTPHVGWFDAAADQLMIEGEQYARAISRARVVPTCGTIARDLVRKHLEVPACGSLLVAEPSATLTAMGFVDGENCLLAPEAKAADRIVEVLHDEAELGRLTTAGRELVLERHTMAARDEIARWYRVRSGAGTPEESAAVRGSFTVLGVEGRDRELLRSAASELEAGRAVTAERLALRAHAFHPMNEAYAALAEARLPQGDPIAAADWAAQGIDHARKVLGGSPDPALWELLVRAERAAGRHRRAARLSSGPAVAASMELRPLARRVRLRWRSRVTRLVQRASRRAGCAVVADLVATELPERILLAARSPRHPVALALAEAVVHSPAESRVVWVGRRGQVADLMPGPNGVGVRIEGRRPLADARSRGETRHIALLVSLDERSAAQLTTEERARARVSYIAAHEAVRRGDLRADPAPRLPAGVGS